MSTTEQTTTETSTSTSTPVSNLLAEVTQLNQEYSKDPDASLAQQRALAVRQAMTSLLTSDEAHARFEEDVRDAGRQGAKTTRLLVNGKRSWGISENVRYNGRYLLDLFNKSELLELMQDWLDEHYGSTDTQRFRVFYHKLRTDSDTGRHHRPRFAVVVSWDTERAGEVDEIIARNREITETHRRDRETRREGDAEPTDGTDGTDGDRRRPQFRSYRPRGGDRGDTRRGRGRRFDGERRAPRRHPRREGGRNFSSFTAKQSTTEQDE